MYYDFLEDWRDAEAERELSWYEQDKYYDIMEKIHRVKFMLKDLTGFDDNVSVEEIKEMIELLEEAENV